MESLFNRYRSLTVLLVAVLAQLLLVAYQVKTGQDVRLIRVWAVNSVAPVARLLDASRTGAARLFQDYFLQAGARQENRRLQTQLDRLVMENRYLKSELGTADRAGALSQFQARTPSRTIAARVIGSGAGANSGVIFVDRGSQDGVKAGMAVVNPDGVVGKVTAAYSNASQVLLIGDPSFAAGVISGKNRVYGIVKGSGRSRCSVEYVEGEAKVNVGEWFYTSGEDRIFPRGLPVGQVKSVSSGGVFKKIVLAPSGMGRVLEEVLVVLEGVHQQVPEDQPAAGSAPLLPPPDAQQPKAATSPPATPPAPVGTDADRLSRKYQKAAESSGRWPGDNPPAAKPPSTPLVKP